MPNNLIPPDLTWTEKLAFLTHHLLTMEQTDCPVTHRFEGELYIREIRLPRDTYMVGRVHREGHVCQLLEGAVVLVHREGIEEGFKAPSQIMTQPGYQMAVYAVEDSVARTIHPNPTGERDIAKLEERIFGSAESVKQLGAELHQELLI